MSKITKKTNTSEEPKIVESEVVKTGVPTTNVKPVENKPTGNNKGLKIGLGICLGCLVIIILIFVGIVATGGFLFKNFALPFAKKVGTEVKTEINQPKNIEENSSPSSNTSTNPVINESNGIPANFPKDFPIYPNAKAIKGAESQVLNKTGYFVTMESSDSVATIGSFYKNKLASSSWSIEKEFGDQKSKFFTTKKGEQTGLITISKKEESNVTIINIVLGGK